MYSEKKAVLGRVSNVVEKAKGAVIGAYTALMLAPYGVFCASGNNGGSNFLNGQATSIAVNADVNAQTVLNRLVGIIAGLFIIVGLFKIATSAFAILEAYSEDNSAAVNKATKQLGIGVVFAAAPLLIGWLLS